jgi:general secretion pathway protein B
MSYILEALKKSQNDRELGDVPRVEGFGIDVPVQAERSHPWAYLALLAALAAAGIAAVLLLRALGEAPPAGDATQVSSPLSATATSEPASTRQAAALSEDAPASARPGYSDPAATPQPPPELAARQIPAAAGPSQPTLFAAPPASVAEIQTGPQGAPQPAPLPLAAPAGTEPATTASALPPLDGPESLSVEPQVLVVPAPGSDGEPLPRGAEELRRAVLGDGARVSASVDSPGAGAADLPRPPPPGEPLSSAPAPSEQTPVPDDVLAEIEAFKELVRKRDPEALKRAAAAPPPLPEPPGLPAPRAVTRTAPQAAPAPRAESLPPRPSLDLRNRLPPFSMTVHVYNTDAARRFIYINGRKLTEGQESREGLILEQVVTDGAVLSYDGERFFQRR